MLVELVSIIENLQIYLIQCLSGQQLQQIMEYNASETQFAVESAMDMIVKLVSSRDNTPLNLTMTLTNPQGVKIPADSITMGAVRDELKKFNYFPQVNARTGVQPSGLLEEARIEKLLPYVVAGTKAQAKLLYSLSQTDSLDLDEEDFYTPAQGQPQGQPGQQQQSGQPQPNAGVQNGAPQPTSLSLPQLPSLQPA